MIRGVALARTPLILHESGVAVPHTGPTAETSFHSVTIPGGIMDINSMLIIAALWSWTNSVNDKVPRIRLNGIAGTVYMGGVTYTTTATLWTPHTIIINAGSLGSQKGFGSMADQTGSSAAVTTSSVNTAVDFTINFTGTLELGSEQINLEYYCVTLIP